MDKLGHQLRGLGTNMAIISYYIADLHYDTETEQITVISTGEVDDFSSLLSGDANTKAEQASEYMRAMAKRILDNDNAF